MKEDSLLKKIAQKAEKNKKNRKEARYLKTMGFLVAKGFLKVNFPIQLLPNKKIVLTDAIWAGKTVEPRILEVLPAAILRFPRHFDLNYQKHPELFAVVEKLKRQEEKGEPLWGIPYEKLRVWAHLALRDKRVKDFSLKRVVKTYRLSPRVVAILKQRSKELACTETEVLERSILGRK